MESFLSVSPKDESTILRLFPMPWLAKCFSQTCYEIRGKLSKKSRFSRTVPKNDQSRNSVNRTKKPFVLNLSAIVLVAQSWSKSRYWVPKQKIKKYQKILKGAKKLKFHELFTRKQIEKLSDGNWSLIKGRKWSWFKVWSEVKQCRALHFETKRYKIWQFLSK